MKQQLLIMLFLFLLSGCALDGSMDLNLLDELNFEYELGIENPDSVYALSDTIWFYTEIEKPSVNLMDQQSIEITNPTVIANFTITKLLNNNDTTDFFDENFSVLVNEGSFVVANVVESEGTEKFILTLQYGLPEATERLKFGLVTKYAGVFAVASAGTLYFGENRENFEQPTETDSELANIIYTLDVENINSKLFYNLPNYSAFETQFLPDLIEAKRFYFFQVQ